MVGGYATDVINMGEGWLGEPLMQWLCPVGRDRQVSSRQWAWYGEVREARLKEPLRCPKKLDNKLSKNNYIGAL